MQSGRESLFSTIDISVRMVTHDVWKCSSHVVTEGSFSLWSKKDGRNSSPGKNNRASDLTNQETSYLPYFLLMEY